MIRPKASRAHQTILLLGICATAGLLGLLLRSHTAASGTNRQQAPERNDEKVIERYQRPGEPFEFGALRLKGLAIPLRHKFRASALAERTEARSGDWIERLQFKIRNTSARAVTFILFQLQFPETELNGPEMVFNLHIGLHPQPSEQELKSHQRLDLDPGDSVTFTLSDSDVRSVKEFLALRNFQLRDLNRVVIRIMSLAFIDGSKWEQDYYYRPSPGSPGGYEKVDGILQ